VKKTRDRVLAVQLHLCVLPGAQCRLPTASQRRIHGAAVVEEDGVRISTRRTFILDRPQRAKNRMAVIKLGSKHILDPEQRDIQLFGLQRQDETRSCNNLWLTESWEAVAFQQHSFH